MMGQRGVGQWWVVGASQGSWVDLDLEGLGVRTESQVTGQEHAVMCVE